MKRKEVKEKILDYIWDNEITLYELSKRTGLEYQTLWEIIKHKGTNGKVQDKTLDKLNNVIKLKGDIKNESKTKQD